MSNFFYFIRFSTAPCIMCLQYRGGGGGGEGGGVAGFQMTKVYQSMYTRSLFPLNNVIRFCICDYVVNHGVTRSSKEHHRSPYHASVKLMVLPFVIFSHLN